MIDEKYFIKLYTILPLSCAADLGECWLEQALLQHQFKLGVGHKYILYIGRELVSELLKIKAGYNLFDISVEIQDNLKDEWYIVNENTKTIVYSPGA